MGCGWGWIPLPTRPQRYCNPRHWFMLEDVSNQADVSNQVDVFNPVGVSNQVDVSNFNFKL